MNTLNCSVANCAHNNDNCCCLGHIDVDGEQATKERETCCSSFDQQNGSMTNSVNTPNPELHIHCKAEECVYNNKCECNAEHVGIAGDGAQQSEGTTCSTFECDHK